MVTEQWKRTKQYRLELILVSPTELLTLFRSLEDTEELSDEESDQKLVEPRKKQTMARGPDTSGQTLVRKYIKCANFPLKF